MTDDKRPTKVYKVVLCHVDHDGIGPDDFRTLLQEANLGNHVTAGTVLSIEERDVEWSDEHPINQRNTMVKAFEELFKR